MLNDWFFKWHFIGRDGPVEIDGFDARKISYGGTKFWGTPREVYWTALGRYARKTIDEIFTQAEEAVAAYPYRQALAAVDDVQRLVGSFLAQVARDAVDKDRILRGDGMNFPAPDRARTSHIILTDEVRARASALRDHYRAKMLPDLNQETGEEVVSDVLILRPSLWGIGIDLPNLCRKIRAWYQSHFHRPSGSA